MPTGEQTAPEKLNIRLQQLTDDLCACYPRSVLLFGSAVAYVQDSPPGRPPNDLDILLIGDNPLIGIRLEGPGPPVELHRFSTGQATAIARSLRYDCRAVALAKLYTKNVARQHARDVILASMLLGPAYKAFGIEQIDIGGLPDPRDYSRHLVLYGHDWWQRLSEWACQRRTFFQRLADKAMQADRFQ